MDKNDFICENRWWNQIGTPDQLVRVLLIIEKIGNNFKTSWDESKNVSEISIQLPLNEYAGKSITLVF
jgi:hypothetical protein